MKQFPNKKLLVHMARKDDEVVIMCRMNVVVNKLMLGNRVLGYECWDGKQICEYTEKQLKDMIAEGKRKVCGLKVAEAGELELDKEGFFTTDMMMHTHIGNYKSVNEDGMATVLYVVIGKHEADGKVYYDSISSKFEQLAIEESDARAYLKMGIISGGAKLDDKGKIVVASLEVEMPVAKVEVKPAEPKAEETKVTEPKDVKKK